jgi:hypothetical protein
MVSQLRIDHITKKIYIKCPYCNDVLVTNDPEYLPESSRNGKLNSIGGCQHFETINIYKDQASLEHNKENFQKALLIIEKKKSFLLIVPRSS